MTEARLALACVLLLAAATATLGSGADLLAPVYPCFVGPAVAVSSVAAKARTEPASALSQGVQSASHRQEQRHRRPGPGGGGGRGGSSTSTASSGTSPLAKRMLLRRALARPKPRAGSGAGTPDPSPSVGADVDNLFRLEVAQRMKEMKLMTQPGVGPLSPGGANAAGSVAATDASLSPPSPLLPSNKKLELESAAALEHQISLLSSRITSIADHLQTTPTDAVSRKGLVVLVKRRRRLLETLRHRDQDRWLATTETLGLRQRRPDSSAGGDDGELTMAARRQRRRDRGRRRRRDDK
ncbi:unnamed protein product [Scytosiphon promiscuus]